MHHTLNDEEKIAMFRTMARHWENKEWRQCADMFTPDGVLHSVMKAPHVGREAFYQRMLELSRPNKSVRLHIQRMGVIDGALIVERTDEVILDGVSRSFPCMGVLQFEGSLISLWREYFDLGQLLWAQRKSDTVEAQPFTPAAGA
jgi:limonene-1,2-epoxide hydrolase